MVNGPSPGPVPAAQAWDSNSRLTRSNWRTWPHRKLRRKVPRVDGALTTQPMAPAVPPVRNTSASSMKSPPASAEATRVSSLSPPAPTDVGQSQTEITGFVFPQSVAAFLGIPSTIVPVGDATFPVLTSDPAAGVPAENASQSETTGAFSADVLTPGRIQASFFWSREDAARMAGMGDSLQEALQGGIADKLDSEIMQGTNGLLTGTILPNNARAAASDYAHYVSSLLYGRVDGRYAYDLADVRVVMGADTFGNAATKLPSAGEENALARIRNDSSGVRVSVHVPATVSHKQNALVRRGMRRDYVSAVWGAVTLIPDEVTKAANGQIVLTAVMLHAVKLLRAGGFHKEETNHS